MAVTSIWMVRKNLGYAIRYATDGNKTSADTFTEEQYQALRDVLAYAEGEERDEREFFVQGINCSASFAREEFMIVKEQFGKTGGTQAYHGYISFRPMEVTPETAQKIGEELVRRIWGSRFQAVVTTHLNTSHLHCHYVINSVSFVDGKKMDKEKNWYLIRRVADEICRKYGMPLRTASG